MSKDIELSVNFSPIKNHAYAIDNTVTHKKDNSVYVLPFVSHLQIRSYLKTCYLDKGNISCLVLHATQIAGFRNTGYLLTIY